MNDNSGKKKEINRRHFLKNSVAAMGVGALAGNISLNAMEDMPQANQQTALDAKIPWRVGLVAYSFYYTIGLFIHSKRSGPRMDVFEFLEATHRAGGDVAQIFLTMFESMDDDGLKRLREHAAKLDMMIQVHGNVAFNPEFEKTIRQSSILGSTVVGCSLGFMDRPNKKPTLDAWDKHIDLCRNRLKQLAEVAKSYNVTIAVENHLDFTVEELRDLMISVDSPHVGVLFDLGNAIGTLNDPVEAVDILGPYIVATHFKDFAVEEIAKGFRLTCVPLGSGSVNLPAIMERLQKYMKPGMGIAIENMCGKQLEVNWLEDRFWVPFRNHSARQVAGTLRHIRSKAINISDYIPDSEIYRWPHDKIVQLEYDTAKRDTEYLRKLIANCIKI